MKRLGVGHVVAPSDIKLLWQRCMSHIPQGSGHQIVLGGWIHALFPFGTNCKPLFGESRGMKVGQLLPTLDLKLAPPKPICDYSNCYDGQREHAEFYLALGWDELAPSVLFVDGTIDRGAGPYTFRLKS